MSGRLIMKRSEERVGGVDDRIYDEGDGDGEGDIGRTSGRGKWRAR